MMTYTVPDFCHWRNLANTKDLAWSFNIWPFARCSSIANNCTSCREIPKDDQFCSTACVLWIASQAM
jgi:hypothetical protein